MRYLAISLSFLLLAGCASQEVFDAPQAATAEVAPAKPVQSSEKKAREPSEAEIMAAINTDNSIFFPPSGVTVDEASRQRLLRHATRLKETPGLQVTLVGHTDHLGSPSYNLAIAEQRINAVQAILRAQRIPVTQIRRQVVGSEEVSINCKSAECRRKMRRVELVFSE
ncbi:OmpA family protein [Azonexus hydrophilus]|uniref:OmpA family protein n=1 Tax=Azonexus hydrophilus TaxID=418702 RepID=A0ABZ2XFP4_9RHOO